MVAALVLALLAAGFVSADRFGLFGRAPAKDHEKYDGKTFRVVHVVDGDTLDVEATDEVRRHPTTRIRLWGVEGPHTSLRVDRIIRAAFWARWAA